MGKKKTPKKRPTPPRAMSSKDLCVSLVSIAAFHIDDPAAQRKIYEAVRRLELLEVAAVAAGLIKAA